MKDGRTKADELLELFRDQNAQAQRTRRAWLKACKEEGITPEACRGIDRDAPTATWDDAKKARFKELLEKRRTEQAELVRALEGVSEITE